MFENQQEIDDIDPTVAREGSNVVKTETGPTTATRAASQNGQSESVTKPATPIFLVVFIDIECVNSQSKFGDAPYLYSRSIHLIYETIVSAAWSQHLATFEVGGVISSFVPRAVASSTYGLNPHQFFVLNLPVF